MPLVTIGSTVIDFPDSAQDPNWAPPVIEFAQATADALSSVVTPGDVVQDTFNIDSINPGTLSVTGLSLNTAIVRGSLIKYAVIRTRDGVSQAEYGHIYAVYNATLSPGSLWTLSRDYTGEAGVSFTIADTGQVSITTTTIAGAGAHTGTLTYVAQSLLQA